MDFKVPSIQNDNIAGKELKPKNNRKNLGISLLLILGFIIFFLWGLFSVLSSSCGMFPINNSSFLSRFFCGPTNELARIQRVRSGCDNDLVKVEMNELKPEPIFDCSVKKFINESDNNYTYFISIDYGAPSCFDSCAYSRKRVLVGEDGKRLASHQELEAKPSEHWVVEKYGPACRSMLLFNPLQGYSVEQPSGLDVSLVQRDSRYYWHYAYNDAGDDQCKLNGEVYRSLDLAKFEPIGLTASYPSLNSCKDFTYTFPTKDSGSVYSDGNFYASFQKTLNCCRNYYAAKANSPSDVEGRDDLSGFCALDNISKLCSEHGVVERDCSEYSFSQYSDSDRPAIPFSWVRYQNNEYGFKIYFPTLTAVSGDILNHGVILGLNSGNSINFYYYLGREYKLILPSQSHRLISDKNTLFNGYDVREIIYGAGDRETRMILIPRNEGFIIVSHQLGPGTHEQVLDTFRLIP